MLCDALLCLNCDNRDKFTRPVSSFVRVLQIRRGIQKDISHPFTVQHTSTAVSGSDLGQASPIATRRDALQLQCRLFITGAVASRFGEVVIVLVSTLV